MRGNALELFALVSTVLKWGAPASGYFLAPPLVFFWDLGMGFTVFLRKRWPSETQNVSGGRVSNPAVRHALLCWAGG